MIPEKLYTVESLAKELGLAERTLREKASRGELPSRKIFGRYYFKGSDIIRYIRENSEEKGGPGEW